MTSVRHCEMNAKKKIISDQAKKTVEALKANEGS
jgi:hypothetical protein